MNDLDITAITAAAHQAGIDAVAALTVTPMIVGEAKSILSNEIDYSKPTEYVADGPCGFAWVDIRPIHKGNTKLGKAERKVYESMGFSKDEYKKCYSLWIGLFNQSVQKKSTYAAAYAEVLRGNGIPAYSGSRMD